MSSQDETEEFLRLSIDPDHHIPVIHLHFNDDLTEANRKKHTWLVVWNMAGL